MDLNGGRSLVLYFLFIFSLGCVYSENITTGTDYTFHPSIKDTIQMFDWRHNGNLVVEMDESKALVWYRYKDRARVDTNTGSLTLQVKKEDSGVFKGEFQVAGILRYFERDINVIDPISTPTVICVQNQTVITLQCSVDPPMKAEFSWTGPNGFSYLGEDVLITKEQPLSEDLIFYCTAKNEVSKKEKEFKLKDCSAGEASNSLVGAIVAGIVISLVLCALGGGLYWIFNRKKASFGGKPGEKEELEAVGKPLSAESDQTSNNYSPVHEVALSKQDQESQGE